MLRRFVTADLAMVGEDQCRIRMTTPQKARDGHVLDPRGCVLDNYRANPIQLWQHDPNQPVGTNSELAVGEQGIDALTTFVPAGVSPKADEVRGLVKAGVIRGVSVGFEVLDAEPLDPKKPRGGQRITRWELLECSFVSIPADTGAVVTARAVADADWKVGASRDLPIEDSDEWDGPGAAASIFEHAGGDDFDPETARKGFLVYNAAEPKLRGSYKLPIAHVAGGELKVPKGAIRAAASRLPQTDIPDDVRDAAGKVLDAYKKKAGMDDDSERAFAASRVRGLMLARDVGGPKLRGLYDVAMLAYALNEVGYLHASNVWEAEVEGDDSKVPAMLGEALQQLGAALIAMTQEEVGELLDAKGLGDALDEDALPPEERAFVRAAATPRVRTLRRGIAAMRVRAGRVLSQGNAKKLQDAAAHHDKAVERTDAARGHLERASEAQNAAADAHSKASAAHERLGSALDAITASPDKAGEHAAEAVKHHRALGRHLDRLGAAQDEAADAQADAADAATGAGRSIRSAQRCVRSILDTTDGASAELPADAEDTAVERAADFRRRQAALLELAAA